MLTNANQAGFSLPDITLGVKGLSVRERQLLEGLVRLSQRDTRHRTMRIELVPDDQIHQAQVILIDAEDPVALAWARQQAWLGGKAVIWLDAQRVPAGHTVTRRPVQWSVLPVVLSRALENAPRSPEPKDAQSTVTAAAAAERPRVLLVDDSTIARTQLRNLVALRGCDTTDAASVDECLALLASERFDMVFMDVLMPGTDGYEGCRRIKAAKRSTGLLPVVMLTSKSSPFDRIRGKIAGCDAYLTKPVDAQQLDQVLAQFAPGSHALPPLMLRQSQHSAPSLAGGVPGTA